MVNTELVLIMFILGGGGDIVRGGRGIFSELLAMKPFPNRSPLEVSNNV